jgi:hypothetical protein
MKLSSIPTVSHFAFSPLSLSSPLLATGTSATSGDDSLEGGVIEVWEPLEKEDLGTVRLLLNKKVESK